MKTASLLRDARHAVAFTGAGLSTECGIPDFRSPDGIWNRFQPIPFAEFLSSQSARNETWRRKFIVDESFESAEPGRGHRILADWAHGGWLKGVITQNIDNLHQRSGLPDGKLIELHGNGTYAKCLACQSHYALADIRQRFEAAGGIAPHCDRCGGLVKSATIAFGQPMPDIAMRRAAEWVKRADVLIVLGSSLVVYPAANLVPLAHEAGAEIIIINREPTPCDGLAAAVLHADIGDTLSALATAIA